MALKSTPEIVWPNTILPDAGETDYTCRMLVHGKLLEYYTSSLDLSQIMDALENRIKEKGFNSTLTLLLKS